MLPTTSRTLKKTENKGERERIWNRHGNLTAGRKNKTLQKSMNERLKTCAHRLLFMVTIIYWDIVRAAIQTVCMQFLAPQASILDVLFSSSFFLEFFFVFQLMSNERNSSWVFFWVYLHDNLHRIHSSIPLNHINSFSFYLDTSTSFKNILLNGIKCN